MGSMPQAMTESRRILFCQEKRRLLDNFLHTIRELNALHRQFVQAVIDDSADMTRLDVALHLAEEKKDEAKFACILHAEEHQCGDGELLSTLVRPQHLPNLDDQGTRVDRLGKRGEGTEAGCSL